MVQDTQLTEFLLLLPAALDSTGLEVLVPTGKEGGYSLLELLIPVIKGNGLPALACTFSSIFSLPLSLSYHFIILCKLEVNFTT